MMNTSVQFFLHPGKTSPGKLSQLWLRVKRLGLIRESYTGLEIDSRYWSEEKQNVTPEHPRSVAISMSLAGLKLRAIRFNRLANSGRGFRFFFGLNMLLGHNGVAEAKAYIERCRQTLDRNGFEQILQPNWTPIPQLEKVIPAFAALLKPVKLPELIEQPIATPAPIQPAPEPETEPHPTPATTEETNEPEPQPAPATPQEANEPDPFEQVRALIEEHGSELVIVVREGETDLSADNDPGEQVSEANPAATDALPLAVASVVSGQRKRDQAAGNRAGSGSPQEATLAVGRGRGPPSTAI